MKFTNTRMTRNAREQKQEMLAGLVECTGAFLKKEISRRMKQHPRWTRSNALMSIYSGRVGGVKKGYCMYVRIFSSLTVAEIKAIPLQLYAFITFLRCAAYSGVPFFVEAVGEAAQAILSREVFRARQRLARQTAVKEDGKPIGGTSRRLRRLRNRRVRI